LPGGLDIVKGLLFLGLLRLLRGGRMAEKNNGKRDKKKNGISGRRHEQNYTIKPRCPANIWILSVPFGSIKTRGRITGIIF